MSGTKSWDGDDDYRINCTGDAVVGDEVRFERAVFSGSYRSPKFEGFELVTGQIVSESYGQEKQQHTFTLELEDGKKSRIKGRNLYKNGVWRKLWADESLREEARREKHERGDEARRDRDNRRASDAYYETLA